MDQSFVVIDVETANPDLASICQVGVVTFEEGSVKEEWEALVDPEDYFDDLNVSIHGIDKRTVKGAPTFPAIVDSLRPRLSDHIVVSHTSFDRTALAQVLNKYTLPDIPCVWLDSARIVRRAWSQFAWKGYGLQNVCDALGIHYIPHNAKEDARAAGEIVRQAMSATGLDLQGWLSRVRQPIDLSKPGASGHLELEGDPNGPLAGEELVFTGSLQMVRSEAALLAAKVGCRVVGNVKKTTTILVVGDQDIRKLAGHEKSGKHRKAEQLIASGQSLRILIEKDFLRLIQLA